MYDNLNVSVKLTYHMQSLSHKLSYVCMCHKSYRYLYTEVVNFHIT